MASLKVGGPTNFGADPLSTNFGASNQQIFGFTCSNWDGNGIWQIKFAENADCWLVDPWCPGNVSLYNY